MSQARESGPEPMSVKVEGTVCTVTFDLRADLGPSTSGKTRVIATTGAPTLIGMTPDGKPVKLGMTAFYKA